MTSENVWATNKVHTYHVDHFHEDRSYILGCCTPFFFNCSLGYLVLTMMAQFDQNMNLFYKSLLGRGEVEIIIALLAGKTMAICKG